MGAPINDGSWLRSPTPAVAMSSRGGSAGESAASPAAGRVFLLPRPAFLLRRELHRSGRLVRREGRRDSGAPRPQRRRQDLDPAHHCPHRRAGPEARRDHARRQADPSAARLSGGARGHPARARRPPHHRRTERGGEPLPLAGRGSRSAGRSSASTSISPGSRSAASRRRRRSPAASSRCWRSRARSPAT